MSDTNYMLQKKCGCALMPDDGALVACDSHREWYLENFKFYLGNESKCSCHTADATNGKETRTAFVPCEQDRDVWADIFNGEGRWLIQGYGKAEEQKV